MRRPICVLLAMADYFFPECQSSISWSAATLSIVVRQFVGQNNAIWYLHPPQVALRELIDTMISRRCSLCTGRIDRIGIAASNPVKSVCHRRAAGSRLTAGRAEEVTVFNELDETEFILLMRTLVDTFHENGIDGNALSFVKQDRRS